MKSKFIEDDMHKAHLKNIYKRIKRGKSVLLVGNYGAGKSTFLDQIRPKKRTIVHAESLSPRHYLLGSILQKLGYDCKPQKSKIMEYLDAICDIKDALIIIDDAGDLRVEVFPYLKRVMDAGKPVIMAGMPAFETRLKEKHVDIFSRLKILHLSPVSVEELKKHLPKFEPDALEVIYGASLGNMHHFVNIRDDCLDQIAELKMNKVTMEIVQMFI